MNRSQYHAAVLVAKANLEAARQDPNMTLLRVAFYCNELVELKAQEKYVLPIIQPAIPATIG